MDIWWGKIVCVPRTLAKPDTGFFEMPNKLEWSRKRGGQKRKTQTAALMLRVKDLIGWGKKYGREIPYVHNYLEQQWWARLLPIYRNPRPCPVQLRKKNLKLFSGVFLNRHILAASTVIISVYSSNRPTLRPNFQLRFSSIWTHHELNTYSFRALIQSPAFTEYCLRSSDLIWHFGGPSRKPKTVWRGAPEQLHYRGVNTYYSTRPIDHLYDRISTYNYLAFGLRMGPTLIISMLSSNRPLLSNFALDHQILSVSYYRGLNTPWCINRATFASDHPTLSGIFKHRRNLFRLCGR